MPTPPPNRRIGVLLVNLGTPDALTPAAIRRYLAEFLSDRRVVEIPQVTWQPILRGVVLPFRPRRSAHAYRQVWMAEGSPLAVHTRRLAEALAGCWGERVVVDWAMRYGSPALAPRLAALIDRGCDRILVAPLYPQYSAATTASVMDALGAALGSMRRQPAIRTLPAYFDEPAHIAALAASIERHVAGLSFLPDRLVASFHGMPERTRALGDPYHDQCRTTARLLAQALGRPVEVSFQSRFGRARWLEPATDAVLAALPKAGVEAVALVTPGFAADCLETLEEIGLRGRDAFLAAGGKNFAAIPCLNAGSDAIVMYRDILSRELAGWIDDNDMETRG